MSLENTPASDIQDSYGAIKKNPLTLRFSLDSPGNAGKKMELNKEAAYHLEICWVNRPFKSKCIRKTLDP